MDNSDFETRVAALYSIGDVTGRILAALGLLDAAPGSVKVDQLFPVDQLHHGGLGLTMNMARLANLSDGQKVLDAGSGIGGSSRFLVDRFGCRVDAIDLSPEYVRTAEALDRLVGLDGRIRHRLGSVTDLPYPDAGFDIVWSQNVTMNVPDKAAMFAEAFRVLRPGGVYVLSHIGAGTNPVIDYPIPWATTEALNFATPPADFVEALRQAGFQNVVDHAADAPPAKPPPMVKGQPDDSAAMGDDMDERRANSGRAVASGALVPMLVTAHR